MGYTAIHEAMEDDKVQEIIEGALQESGEALIRTYGFNRKTHQQYIDKIIKRYMNPYISDEVTRVGRGPIRKLGPNDRLTRPASLYLELTGEEPENLAKTIAAALAYKNPDDDEAVKLQKMIDEQGYDKTLQSVSGLEANDPLIAAVLRGLSLITLTR